MNTYKFTVHAFADFIIKDNFLIYNRPDDICGLELLKIDELNTNLIVCSRVKDLNILFFESFITDALYFSFLFTPIESSIPYYIHVNMKNKTIEIKQ